MTISFLFAVAMSGPFPFEALALEPSDVTGKRDTAPVRRRRERGEVKDVPARSRAPPKRARRTGEARRSFVKESHPEQFIKGPPAADSRLEGVEETVMAKKEKEHVEEESVEDLPLKKYDLVDKEDASGKEVYKLIAEVKKRFKKDLEKCRFGAAWAFGQRADKDGRVQLGKLKRCSELEQRYHSLDAVLILNSVAWLDLKKEQRLALVHHLLCRIAQAIDVESGEQTENGHGDKKWRGVKPEIVDFAEVGAAHGCWVKDIATYVEKIHSADPNLSLFDPERNARAEKPVGKDVMAKPADDDFASPETQPTPCAACGHTEFNHKVVPRARCLVKGCKCEGFARPRGEAKATAAEAEQAH